MIVLSRDQVRKLDRIAVDRFGIPGIVLMENAGRGAADLLHARFDLGTGTRVAILAGPGNNGGDGFVIARHLALRGVPVSLLLLGPRDRFQGPGEAGVNFSIAERMGIPLDFLTDPADLSSRLPGFAVLVDAVLGTGLSGEVRGLAREAIEAMNLAGSPVLAVDTPSGLDCDSGKPLGTAVRASATVTFAAMKKGFLEPGAERYTGPVDVVDIGCPLVWE